MALPVLSLPVLWSLHVAHRDEFPVYDILIIARRYVISDNKAERIEMFFQITFEQLSGYCRNRQRKVYPIRLIET